MNFSKKLFLKEYRKAFSYLNEEEQNELKRWVRVNRVKENSATAHNNQEEVQLRHS